MRGRMLEALAWTTLSVAGIAAPALAQAPAAARAAIAEAPSLSLVCMGTDAAIVTMPTYGMSGRGYLGNPAYGFGYGEGRVGAQLAVLVDGDQVRVRPPESSIPLLVKRPKDGWYVLRDATVDRLSIRGRARLSAVERVRLDIDRRTGTATFGAFSGVCRPVATTDGVKF